MPRLPQACLALLLASGCIAGTESLQDGQLTDSQGFFLAGAIAANDEIHVMRVFQDGRLEPFGPALPDVLDKRDRLEAIHYDRSGTRAVVLVAPQEDGGRRRLFAGDAERWRLLAETEGASNNLTPSALKTSPDLSVIGYQNAARFRGEWQYRVNALTFEGDEIFASEWTQDLKMLPSFVTFAPDGSWFITRQGNDLTLRLATGEVRGERLGVESALYESGIKRAFETSLLVQNNDRSLTWVGLDFEPIEVEGFDPAARIHGTYQVSNGFLARLEDRSVVPLFSLGGYEEGGLVLAEAGGRAFIERPLTPTIVGVADGGEVAFEYEPPPPTLEPSNGSDRVRVYLEVLNEVVTDQMVTLVLELHYEAGADPDRVSFQETVEVLRVPAEGEPKATTIKTDRNPYLPTYLLDQTAKSLSWIEEESLFLVTLTSGEKHKIGSDLRWPDQRIVASGQ